MLCTLIFTFAFRIGVCIRCGCVELFLVIYLINGGNEAFILKDFVFSIFYTTCVNVCIDYS